MIQSLIDKQDMFEIMRDQIALILKQESASQMALATTAGKDPDEWKLRIFTERSNPFEQWLNETTDFSPIVNVWVDSSSFPMSGGNTVETQKSETIFNIDCYGNGYSESDGAGHKAGDKEAALQAQKATRLVRNILMSSIYTYLGMQGTVWRRWINSINFFVPQGQKIQKIIGARIALKVEFNEQSPQYEAVELEQINIDIIRSETGEILLEADYDYTTP